MRWTASVILFVNVFYLVVSAESDEAAPYLHVITKSSVYNVGEKKAIYCKGTNLLERLEWYSNTGEVVETRSNKNTRVYVERQKNESLTNSLLLLIIHSTKIKDSGNWTCKSGALSETIDVLVGEKVNLGVTQEATEGEEGKNIKLDCVAKGHPAPAVQWYKDSVLIDDDRRKYIVRKREDNYQLEIKNLTHTDTGEYMCKVTQKVLSYYTYKRVQLTVQHKPLIVNDVTNEVYYTRYKTEEVYAILNETKNITCSAIAHPPPTYHWFRRYDNGLTEVPIEDEDTVLHSADGTSSVLVLRLYNESYLGEYKCSANNTKGHVSIVFHVSVGNKPTPPDFISLVSASPYDLTFNVTCSTCNMGDDESDEMAQDPRNLPVLGYSFALVKVHKGYEPDWDAATEFLVDIEGHNDTLYTVGPLVNDTTYHARVRSRNAAGFSEWLMVTPDPTTAANAIKIVASILLLVVAVFVNFH
ncbi:protein amalgam-like [Aricia agestis]|uniref:protein amalgam-like n=1 Tax=Aricia agestis TaxID=91739 RepID=UPI001C202967|nr:protein amalgam-like [Aricia agestis]